MTTHEQRILVHKEGAEGSIELHALTGQVTTPTDELPDWAEGLIVGLIVERKRWYETRLGKERFEAQHRDPHAIIMQDLGWVAIDPETGEEMEVEADSEYRMGVIAKVLGIDLEPGATGETSENFGKVLAEVEIALDTNRTVEEASAIDAELATTFGGNVTSEDDLKSAHG